MSKIFASFIILGLSFPFIGAIKLSRYLNMPSSSYHLASIFNQRPQLTFPLYLNQTSSRQLSITSSGIRRDYLLYVPPNPSPRRPLPLVLAFHGGKTTPNRFAATTKLYELARSGKAVVAFPAGINRGWNDGSGVINNNIDDLKFVRDLINNIRLSYPIDSKRIYATGISNGGFLVQYLACAMPEYFAAFSTVASTLSHAQASSCKSSQPVSIMMFNSPQDSFIPWEGGQQTKGGSRSLLSVNSTYDFWLRHNDCNGFTLSPSPTTSTTSSESLRILVKSSKACSSNSMVILYEIQGGGHTWPGGYRQPEFLVGPTTHQISATDLSWAFFMQHKRS